MTCPIYLTGRYLPNVKCMVTLRDSSWVAKRASCKIKKQKTTKKRGIRLLHFVCRQRLSSVTLSVSSASVTDMSVFRHWLVTDHVSSSSLTRHWPCQLFVTGKCSHYSGQCSFRPDKCSLSGQCSSGQTFTEECRPAWTFVHPHRLPHHPAKKTDKHTNTNSSVTVFTN